MKMPDSQSLLAVTAYTIAHINVIDIWIYIAAVSVGMRYFTLNPTRRSIRIYCRLSRNLWARVELSPHRQAVAILEGTTAPPPFCHSRLVPVRRGKDETGWWRLVCSDTPQVLRGGINNLVSASWCGVNGKATPPSRASCRLSGNRRNRRTGGSRWRDTCLSYPHGVLEIAYLSFFFFSLPLSIYYYFFYSS